MNPASRDPGQGTGQPRGRGKAALIVLLTGLTLAFAGFTTLGIWQLHRLEWKLDLIKRVESRIHATPVTAPAPAQWHAVSANRDEYRHVRLDGRFLPDHDTRVQALSTLGAGFWVLSPFQTTDGYIVLVNRGFVPGDWKGDLATTATTVTGLLRLSEPGGAFLRHNDPAAGRWYSRDVHAIATAQGLNRVAPYFIDADASPGKAPGNSIPPPDSATLVRSADITWPRGSLTVTHFSNNHLGYALTWFALALMCAGAAVYVARDEWRRHHTSPRTGSLDAKPDTRE